MQRAIDWRLHGLRDLDALHLACAERSGVEMLVTTDDAFISAARRLTPASSTRVVNPVVYALEAMNHDFSLLPLPVLREKGFAILVRELGPANALRFLHLYQAGTGNYTTEREQWLGSLTLEEIDAEIKHLKLQGDI